MSFLRQTRQQLGTMAGEGNTGSRVINGRLYTDTGHDGIYRAVPCGMDDSRDLKIHPVPDYVVKDEKEYPVVDGAEYMKDLREKGVKFFPAEKADRFAALEAMDYTPQDFVRIDESVAIMQISGDGRPAPQILESGDYLTMSGDGNVYGVSAEEFDNTYAVLNGNSGMEGREIPDVSDSGYDDGYQME